MAFKFCEACNNKVMATMRICPQCGGKSFADTPSVIPAPPQVNTQAIGSQTVNASANNQTLVVSQVRPWIRYWARILDAYAFSLIAGFFLYVIAPEFMGRVNEYVLALILLFSWIFVESLLLLSFGTTPGKWLLNIRITSTTGSPITYSQALARSMKVWWRGFGTGFPLVQLVTTIVAYQKLTLNGVTSWDKEEHFAITHEKVGLLRGVVATLFILGVLILAGQHKINKNHPDFTGYKYQSYTHNIYNT